MAKRRKGILNTWIFASDVERYFFLAWAEFGLMSNPADENEIIAHCLVLGKSLKCCGVSN